MLPSYRFRARLTELPPQPVPLVGVVRNALLFITCVMDVIENPLNPSKPHMFDDDDEIEDVTGALIGLLEQAMNASLDPAQTLAWERQAVLGRRTRYPADRDTPELTFGEPVTRDAFERATQA